MHDIVVNAEDDNAGKVRIVLHLIAKSSGALLDLNRTRIFRKAQEAERTVRTIVALPQVGPDAQSQVVEGSRKPKQILFSHPLCLWIIVLLNKSFDLRSCPRQ